MNVERLECVDGKSLEGVDGGVIRLTSGLSSIPSYTQRSVPLIKRELTVLSAGK